MPRPVISGSDQLRLTFYSDHQKERRGFALTFQPVNVTQCGGEHFAVSGNIQSPNYPFFYPPNAICIWKIQVKIIKIRLGVDWVKPWSSVRVKWILD